MAINIITFYMHNGELDPKIAEELKDVLSNPTINPSRSALPEKLNRVGTGEFINPDDVIEVKEEDPEDEIFDPAEANIRNNLYEEYENIIRELMGLSPNDDPEEALEEIDFQTYQTYMDNKTKNEYITATLEIIKKTGRDLEEIDQAEVTESLKDYIFSQA